MGSPEETEAYPVTVGASPPDSNIPKTEKAVPLENQPASIEKETVPKSEAGSSSKEADIRNGDLQDLEKANASRDSHDRQHNINGKAEHGTAAEISSEEEDANVVWWDGPDDPHNPLNFSKSLKAVTITVISGITFVTPLASSMFAPGVPQLMEGMLYAWFHGF